MRRRCRTARSSCRWRDARRAGATLALRLTVSRHGRGRRRHGLRRAYARHRRPARRRSGSTSRCRGSQLDPHRILSGPGLYQRRHRREGVARLHLPLSRAWPRVTDVPTRLGGPEQVFRFTLRRPVANFGVVSCTARRDQGLAAPRRRQRREPPRRLHRDSGEPEPVPGLRPAGARRRRRPARPGHVRLRLRHADGREARARSRSASGSTTRHRRRSGSSTTRHTIGRPIRLAVRDSGSGVDPRSFHAKVGGKRSRLRTRDGVLPLRTKASAPGSRP